MILASLFALSLENIINNSFYCSPALKMLCKKLNNKSIYLSLKELRIMLIIHFSENQVDVLNVWEKEQADCYLVIQIGALIKLLYNNQEPTDLLRNGNIELEGDIKVALGLMALFILVKSDPFELLASYTGDIVAASFNKILFKLRISLSKKIKYLKYYITEALVKELRIAPRALEVEWFIEKEIVNVKYSVDMLVKRLEKLEKNK